MDNIKLTIGIPTWNRSVEIANAIDSILTQVGNESRHQIEILISDNASTDETQAVLDGYVKRYPELFSTHRNPENVGFSRNVDTLFRHAQGEFVLILSDDDALEADALSEIFFAMDHHPDVCAIFVLSTTYDGELKHANTISKWRASGADNTLGASCVYYDSGADFYRARGYLCNVCISGNLFRTAAWREIDMSAGLASNSVQLHAGIQILARGSVCLIDKPLVKYRDGGGAPELYLATRGDGKNTGWPFVYFFDTVSACKAGYELYPQDIYKAFYLTCVRGVFYTLLNVKAKNGYIDRSWFEKRLSECFDPQCHGWLIGLHLLLVRLPGFLFIVPNYLYRFGRKLYFFFQKKH